MLNSPATAHPYFYSYFESNLKKYLFTVNNLINITEVINVYILMN